jgi:hypothetical protein
MAAHTFDNLDTRLNWRTQVFGTLYLITLEEVVGRTLPSTI